MAYVAFEDSTDPDAYFLAAAIGRIVSRNAGSIWSGKEVVDRVKRFFVRFPNFNVPVLQYQLCRHAAKAAPMNGLKIQWTAEKGMRYPEAARRDCPQHLGDESVSLTTEAQNNPKYYYEAVHPQDKALDYMVIFYNCVKLMQKWLDEEREDNINRPSNYPSIESAIKPDRETFASVVLPKSDDEVYRILGQVTGRPSKFNISPEGKWVHWLEPVQNWLMKDDTPGPSLLRHCVLKMLVDLRLYCSTEACRMVDRRPDYDTLRIRYSAIT